MARMYSSTLDLAGLGSRKVVVCNVSPEDTQSSSVSVDCMHHIHVLDRSGSMYADIDELIENVKETIRFIPDGDYVSIVWFSGPSECKVLIKGAQKNDSLYGLLDTLKSVLGVTCFSVPMKEVGGIIDDLQAICPNFCVTVFTDGQPVVSWGTDEEIKRTLDAIGCWNDKVLAVNTIGYGNYYDQEFLKQMSAMTTFGQFIHSSLINEYASIFSHNYEVTSELVLSNIEVVAPGKDIMYLTSKLARKSVGASKTRALDKRKNQFVIIGEDDQDFSFSIGEQTYNSADFNEIPSSSINPILYAYAYTSYYEGNRKVALDVIAKVLRDKYLVDLMRNAFTYDEVAAATKILKSAVFSGKYRMYEGECDVDYVAADNAICLMDLLSIILDGDDSFYKYSTEYNRIGKKVVDTFNLFHRNNDEEVLTPVSDLVFNKSRLNISIRSIINGTVSLNPKQAAKVGLPTELPSKIYRNQTLIKDGAPNMDTVTFRISQQTYNRLLEVISLDHPAINISVHVPDGKPIYFDVTIHLHEIPIINYSYVGDCTDVDGLLDKTYQLTRLQACQKVLGYIKDDVMEHRRTHGIFDVSKQFAMYTPAQIEVLTEHGLNDRAEYVGVNNTTEKSGDSYVTRELEFMLKGYSTFPSREKLYEKTSKGAKLNGPETMMHQVWLQYLDDFSANEYGSNLYLADVNHCIQAVKSSIARLRMSLAAQKIALVLTGEWFSGLEVDKKGNYLYTKGDNTLVIKANRTTIEL